VSYGGKLRRFAALCSSTNPIDLLEEATPERFRNVLDICFKDKVANGFLIIYTPQGAMNLLQLQNSQ
jgi:acetyltransferase